MAQSKSMHTVSYEHLMCIWCPSKLGSIRNNRNWKRNQFRRYRSETKRLFRLFRFYTGTEISDVSIEPKQTKDQPKQFDMEHIFVFFSGNLRFFLFFSVYFGLFRNSCFGCFAFIPKQKVLMQGTHCYNIVGLERLDRHAQTSNATRSHNGRGLQSRIW